MEVTKGANCEASHTRIALSVQSVSPERPANMSQ